ncbi:hypothetical protein FRX31_021072 [Thalictrum thalictroides]|uniref:Uncharacterized protein n=1 Tax=Thalictrum thalictroides TaxID=46969 RepID=A0A7J6VWX9_THATH|nr:hypothetical protein FRX31_021072 [Thalictrum thalictroides]
MAPTNNNEFVKKSNLDVAINGLKNELKAEFKEDLRLQLKALTKLIKDSLTPQQPSMKSSSTIIGLAIMCEILVTARTIRHP